MKDDMTQEETLEYNKLCAEFIGAKNLGKKGHSDSDYFEHYLFIRTEWSNKFQDNIEISTITPFNMKFHSDWNWIIEVVEAIEKLKYLVVIQSNFCQIQEIGTKENNFKPLIIASLYGNDKKEAVVDAIYKFLTWYNENKTN